MLTSLCGDALGRAAQLDALLCGDMDKSLALLSVDDLAYLDSSLSIRSHIASFFSGWDAYALASVLSFRSGTK